MSRRARGAIGGTIGLVALIAGATASIGDTLDGSLSGAWTTSAADCKRLFERRGGALAYRPPVDKFAQAAIISPQEIRLPSNTCRIQTVTHASGVTKIGADCHDSISFTQQMVQIKVSPGGGIVYSPTGDSALDTALVRCPL
jgi:hypothetical protein